MAWKIENSFNLKLDLVEDHDSFVKFSENDVLKERLGYIKMRMKDWVT